MSVSPAIQRVLEIIDRLQSGDGNAEAPEEWEISAAVEELSGGERVLAQRLLTLANEQQTWRRNLVQTAKLAEVGMAMAELVHELRQPLSGISGFAQLLNPDRPKEIAGQVKEILTQSSRMERMIERMRRFLRADEGENVDCQAEVEVAIQSAMALFAKTRPGVTIDVRVVPQLPKVVGELNPLIQVLSNLVTNARDAQSSQGPGTILVQATREDESVVVLVADQGPGIAEAFRPRLFKPFATTKGEAGTGLGLYISQQIVSAWGGEIKLLDHPPAPFSTAFTVRLRAIPEIKALPSQSPGLAATLTIWPAVEPLRQELQSKLQGFSAQGRVLVVDDEPAVRRLLRVLLADCAPQAVIEEAADGAEAMELLSRQRAQMLVVDRNLSGMSGLDLVRKARAPGLVMESLVITGFPTLPSVLDALDLGVCDYLVKPLTDVESLRQQVINALQREQWRQMSVWMANDLRPWAARLQKMLLAHSGQVGSRLREAIDKLARPADGPARIAVLGSKSLAGQVSLAGHLVEETGDKPRKDHAAFDLLLVGDELTESEAWDTVGKLAQQPWPPRVLWARPLSHFEQGLKLLHAGVFGALASALSTTVLSGALTRAMLAHQQATRWQALAVILAELKIDLAIKSL